ncbi:hypothetical protein HGO38_28920 [Rhizobium sp. CG5]|uniref:hypothetical protein n=1 Tax=Rhizobium sp. CG5 TaxID=2726076 RepID=UPI0020335EF9|nr:hypothetical protein [Rhizobium sp. CG5]MCM2477474.1 hypothetical protein [Rhizobium sp. CG5]
MEPRIKIADTAIWFKHVDSIELQTRLRTMRAEEGIHLEADGVIGRWVRMKTGKDGRPTDAIRPDGSMKEIWSEWYRTRRGEVISLREVRMSDDYLRNIASLFPEWDSKEDDEAFRDL